MKLKPIHCSLIFATETGKSLTRIRLLVPKAHRHVRAITTLQIDYVHEALSTSEVRHYSLSQDAKHRSSLSHSILATKVQRPEAFKTKLFQRFTHLNLPSFVNILHQTCHPHIVTIIALSPALSSQECKRAGLCSKTRY